LSYLDKLYVVADGRDNATAAAFKKFSLDRDLSAALRFRSCSSHHQTIATVELSALRSLMPLGVGKNDKKSWRPYRNRGKTR